MEAQDWLEVGRRLRQARQEVRLGQDEAARMAGTRGPTLNRYEGGDRTVSLEKMVRLSQLYGRPVSWFLEPIEDAYERERLSNLDLLFLERVTAITPEKQRVLAKHLETLCQFVQDMARVQHGGENP